jgi:hypothetical protein
MGQSNNPGLYTIANLGSSTKEEDLDERGSSRATLVGTRYSTLILMDGERENVSVMASVSGPSRSSGTSCPWPPSSFTGRARCRSIEAPAFSPPHRGRGRVLAGRKQPNSAPSTPLSTCPRSGTYRGCTPRAAAPPASPPTQPGIPASSRASSPLLSSETARTRADSPAPKQGAVAPRRARCSERARLPARALV